MLMFFHNFCLFNTLRIGVKIIQKCADISWVRKAKEDIPVFTDLNIRGLVQLLFEKWFHFLQKNNKVWKRLS